MGLVGFICPQHGYINVEHLGYRYCEQCEQEGKTAYKGIRNNTNGSTYFDTSVGDYINTKDIDNICKEKGWLYGNDTDIEAEGQRNHQRNKLQAKQEFMHGLENELRKAL